MHHKPMSDRHVAHPRVLVVLLLASLTFACWVAPSRTERSGTDTQAPPPAEASAAPSPDSIARLAARLRPMLAPIAAFRDSMQIALRSDSGAVRADSLFMRYRGSLEKLVRVLGKMLEDSSFHTVVYPRELRIGLPLDSLGAVTADSVIRFLSLRGIWTYRGEEAHTLPGQSALQNTFGRFLTEEAQDLHLDPRTNQPSRSGRVAHDLVGRARRTVGEDGSLSRHVPGRSCA
jgi:hypothetical protein